jgi:hypothetical protein
MEIRRGVDGPIIPYVFPIPGCPLMCPESGFTAFMSSSGSTLSHPVLEGKPNVNHVRARIRNSRTHRLQSWTSSHSARNNSGKDTLLHQDVQDIHRVINIT